MLDLATYHPHSHCTARLRTGTQIWISASDGDIEAVKAYLETNPALLNAGDENGYTPMYV